MIDTTWSSAVRECHDPIDTDTRAAMHGARRRQARYKVLTASLLVVLAHLLFLADVAPARAETVDAIWKTQRVIFRYSSRNTAYSCAGLSTKLAAVLQRVGAHEDIRVVGSGCDEVSGLLTFDVLFRAPVPATDENLREATDYDARTELAARLRGERLAAAEDIERFAAEWQTISVGQDRKLRLAPSECDLLQQILRSFFSRMSVNTTGKKLRCSSGLGDFHPPRLTVTALIRAAESPLVGIQ